MEDLPVSEGATKWEPEIENELAIFVPFEYVFFVGMLLITADNQKLRRAKTFMPKQPIQRVEKPWGYELIWAETKDYVGKILHINKGHRLSLQYHQIKEETLFLFTGKMNLVFENESGTLEDILMTPGEAHHIPTGRKHRMIALEDCDVFEVSTPHLSDVIRLEDGYGRKGTSQP